MDNPETLATLGTHNTEKWTVQKYWQHWLHTTQENGQSRNTGNIGYTRHRIDCSKETLEKTEDVIKNLQSIDTDSITHTRQRSMTNYKIK